MSTLLAKYATYEEELMGKSSSPIIAHAGGGQGSATALAFKWNVVTTCASDFDSVKLVTSKQGYQQMVLNDTAQVLSIYPVAGEKINGILNARIDILPGQSGAFECTKDGSWIGYSNTSSGIQVVSKTLSSAEIKTLFTVPVQLLPAPGATYAIEMISASLRYNFGGIAYTGGGQIQLITDTAAANNYQLRSVNLFAGASFFERFILQSISANMVANKGILITTDTSNFAAGDGTADIYASYRIITL